MAAEDMAIISLANYDAGLEAIKRRSGDSSTMTSADIATRVDAIPGPKPEQTKSVAYTANGSHTISPDAGKVLTSVTVDVNVPSKEPVVQPLTATENKTYNPPHGVDGFSPVTVNVPTGSGGDIDALIDRSIAGTILTEATSIGDNVFENCTNLTAVDAPKAASIGDFAFSRCANLTTVDVPNATQLGHKAFAGCASLTTTDFSKVVSIPENDVFQGCDSLVELEFPSIKFMGNAAIDFDSLNNYTFETLRLSGNTFCKLFGSARVGALGIILVPRALVDQYKAAPNWELLADRIYAIEDYPKGGAV